MKNQAEYIQVVLEAPVMMKSQNYKKKFPPELSKPLKLKCLCLAAMFHFYFLKAV